LEGADDLSKISKMVVKKENEGEYYRNLEKVQNEYKKKLADDEVYQIFKWWGSRPGGLSKAFLDTEEKLEREEHKNETKEEREARLSLVRKKGEEDILRREFLAKLAAKKSRYVDYVTGQILLRIWGPCKHNENASIHGFPKGCALHRELACPFIHKDEKELWNKLSQIDPRQYQKETKAFQKALQDLRNHARDRKKCTSLVHPSHISATNPNAGEGHREEEYSRLKSVAHNSTRKNKGRQSTRKNKALAARAFGW